MAERLVVEEILDGVQPAQELTLTDRQLYDALMAAIGGYRPLSGFVSEEDYHAIVDTMHLSTGELFAIPIVLAVQEPFWQTAAVGDVLRLRDAAGTAVGLLDVSAKYLRSLAREARKVYGTVDASHPGVAKIFEEGHHALGGEVRFCLPRFENRFPEFFKTPRQTRDFFNARGWKTVVAFQTRNPIHRSHEYLTKVALETADGLMLHPIVGEVKDGDISAAVRMECYKALLENYYNPDRVLLNVLPMAMRYAGPREAVHHAVVRRNYGCTHIIIGRDHAGVGSYYGTYDAQKIFETLGAHELRITPLLFENSFYCGRCGQMATAKTCPHDASFHLTVSGTRVREALREGGTLPRHFTRPEIACVLKSSSAQAEGAERAVVWHEGAVTRADREERNGHRGAVIWLTGLPASGKSTLAVELEKKLFARGFHPFVLDGDNVRHGLSCNLGFSPEDRKENIRRIGEVAKLFMEAGTIAIAAFVSPYRADRDAVRALVRDGLFLEVHVKADVETCIARDPKGMYRKALDGRIPEFTGVSAPYEEPLSPELVIDTGASTVEEAVERLHACLVERGVVPPA